MVLHACTVNGTHSALCMLGSYIISGNESTVLRNYFTIAFTVLQSIIPFVGALAIKRLNQRRALTRGETVPLRLISSWLSVPSALFYVFRTRRLPGRYWGVIMLLVGCFSWATHFLVNGIAFVSIPSSCHFDQGIVVDLAQPGMRLHGNTPPLLWSAGTWAISSQRTSSENRRLVNLKPSIGISKKANNHSSFYASDDDLLGGWNCSLSNPSGSNHTIRNNRTDVASQFNHSGLLYPSNYITELTPSLYATDQIWNTAGEYYSIDSVLVWSPSPNPDSWDVKAAMMSGIDVGKETFNVTAWHCELVPAHPANVTVTHILKITNSVDTLEAWAPAVLGVIRESSYDPVFYKSTLELYLNAIIMASGSHNVANKPPPDDDKMYRCIQQVTRIPIVTVLAVGLEIIVLLALLLFDIILLLTIRFKPDYKKVEDMPTDVLEMQLAFVRQLENDTENTIQPKHLVSYAYGFAKEKDMDMLRVQHVNSAPQLATNQSIPSSATESSRLVYERLPSDVELGPIGRPP